MIRLLNNVLISSRNCWHCAACLTATAWFAYRKSYRHVYGYNESADALSRTAQFSLLCEKFQAQYNVFCFVRDYVVRFNTKDIHCENLDKQENSLNM